MGDIVMFQTPIAWLILLVTLAAAALLLRRPSPAPGRPSDTQALTTVLQDIAARVSSGKLSAADADAERLASLMRLQSPRLRLQRAAWQAAGAVRGPAAATFVLVLGLGAVVSLAARSSGDAEVQHASMPTGGDDDLVASMKRYVSGSGHGSETATPKRADLPDVETMAQRLAARLEANPNDVEGWRMLGWTYYQTEDFAAAETALGKAVALNPSSDELKRAYEAAKTRAAERAG